MRKPTICRFLLLTLVISLPYAGQAQTLVKDVRAAIAADDFTRGAALVSAYRAEQGVTPLMLEALSWLGRGALAANQLQAAEEYARETHELALDLLKTRELDDEPSLPIALGAAIEVQAQAAAASGERSLAVQFLRQELATYAGTSLHKRLRKNINLLSLEGESAPPLDLSEYLGPTPPRLADLKGRVVVLFFWAHWCPDCKNQGPILEDLAGRYGAQGLAVVAPTQRFGYAERGRPVSRVEERRYIEQVRDQYYPFLKTRPVPLAEANHKLYGVSTTPTLVLLDRDGKIALYHPGQMTTDELEPLVKSLIEARGTRGNR